MRHTNNNTESVIIIIKFFNPLKATATWACDLFKEIAVRFKNTSIRVINFSVIEMLPNVLASSIPLKLEFQTTFAFKWGDGRQ